ncbi:MAG: Tat pathway signal sequence, partial [Raoultibacter sp.]
NVAVGDTVAACQKSYKTLLATNGVINEAEGAGAEEITGVIKNITQAVVEGNSHFYLTLVDNTRIFDCAFPGLIEVVGYAPGESIVLHFTQGDPTCPVLSIGTQTGGSAAADTAKDTAASVPPADQKPAPAPAPAPAP